MKTPLFLMLAAALLGLPSFALQAQDGEGKKGPKPNEKNEKKEKGGEPKGEGKKEKDRAEDSQGGKKGDCGVDRDGYLNFLKKFGKSDGDSSRDAAEHFKKHPDGQCHCFCGHSEAPVKKPVGDGEKFEKKKDCGVDRDGYLKFLKKSGKGDEDCSRDAADHFKKHPDGQCHCFCGHSEAPVKKPVGDGEKFEKKKECGVDRDGYLKFLKKSGKGDDDCNRDAAEHFKKHPDGHCHCLCGHSEEPVKKPVGDGEKFEKKKDCGVDRDEFGKGLKKTGKSDGDCDRESAEHFKKLHPDGVCHCSCEHSGKPKGNNGVGNGVDPQPPGNPKPNDGPGTGPGNPGNKGGPTDKGKPKGNNGVGNGVDPQPPGNPKPNDGPGSSPGNPGNKGGPADKGKGKS